MTKLQDVYFTVEGDGEFPYDMLRYDRCWPETHTDSGRIDPPSGRQRRVVLHALKERHWLPSAERWKSFGWTVIGIRAEPHGAQLPLHQAGITE